MSDDRPDSALGKHSDLCHSMKVLFNKVDELRWEKYISKNFVDRKTN